MWQRHYETTTDVPAEKLFRAIADIDHWNEWDSGLERTRLNGVAKPGASFVLKPKGGRDVRMSIEELSAPERLVDVAHLPMAKIRTSHEFLQSGDLTTVRFTVQVWGMLGYFWRKVVGEKQIEEAPAQTACFIQYARARP
ncbi:MAG: SRPBCC family protein [Gemmatimonadaceae bacterium]